MGNLFNGPVLVIDDQAKRDDTKDTIKKLIREIESNGYPCIIYDDIPEDPEAFVKHLSGFSFLLLDWRLFEHGSDDPDLAGLVPPVALGEAIVDFIKLVTEETFIPIFIATNEKNEKVVRALKKAKLYDPKDPLKNSIFIKKKTELVKGSLFVALRKWAKESPSIYALKEWEREYTKAKNSLFLEFFKISHAWPEAIWTAANEDNSPSPSDDLGEAITKNLYTRMAPFKFDRKNILVSDEPASASEVRKVMEGERFIANTFLDDTRISPGDIFDYTGENRGSYRYLLNIRPMCDTVLGRDPNPDLYFLKGKKASKSEAHTERGDQQCVPFLFNGKVIAFSFKDLVIKSWEDVKNDRKGRLLEPYITRVQQKYGLFIQRQGLPRAPWQAYFDQKPVDEYTLYKDKRTNKWCLELGDSAATKKVFSTKAIALNRLKTIVGKKGGRVKVLKLDNTIQKEITF